jgi:sortase (surface protein transpeptidase)
MVSQLASSMTTVIAIMLLVFVAEMVLVGHVRHARSQHVLYLQFRSQLANAVAPTGFLGADGKPVPFGDPVAVMAIPKIGVKEVVVQGTTSGVLASGPGHRRDTPLPGQSGTSVIFGRQATYGGPFRRIASLEPGDEIAFATGQGNALYEVTGVRRAGDPAPAPDPQAARLTLLTGAGTPYLASDVVRVDAELRSTTQPSPAMPVSAASLGSNEAAMSNDRSALVQLLLWCQLLLVVTVALAWVRAVWGRWQSWIVSVPVIGVIGLKVAALFGQLLPNLL